MKLTPRLEAIASLIESNTKVADVGSDHGYLAVYLHQLGKGIIPIASDINVGPVENAKETLIEEKLEHEIEVRLGGGLEPYSLGEVDVAVIAGMGGILIKDIIEQSLDKIVALKYAVLQPMTQQPYLRQWLIDNHFEIFNERFVNEGSKFYEIFCIRSGQMPEFNEIAYDIGFNRCDQSQSKEEYKAFLSHKLEKFEQVRTEIENKGSMASQAMLDKLVVKILSVREVLENVR